MNSSVELIGTGRPGRVGVVDDGLVRHEESNYVGQLPRMGEIDGVSRPIDHDEDAVVFRLTGHFVDARRTREQWVPAPGNDERWFVSSEQPVQRWILRERPEHAEGARNAESQIIRDCDA